MSAGEWASVVDARREANFALRRVEEHRTLIDSHTVDHAAVATLVSAHAICLELRALGEALVFAASEPTP